LSEAIALQGEVVSFRWANPHALVVLKVAEANGTTSEWQVETQATPTLARSGWTKTSLKPGDHVTVRAFPDRNRARHYALLESVLKDDGAVLALVSADTPLDAARPRAASVLGVWQAARRREGGAGYAPGPASEAPFALPLTDKGLEAARRYNFADSPRIRCVPYTTPEILGGPYLHTIERNGEHLLLRSEYMEVDRTVYMDGRSPPPQRSMQGHSLGRWEGDVLVVETTNFADAEWGTARGIPSGAGKRVVERYRLTDDGETLTVDFTIEDPEYLNEPYSGSELWRYAPQIKLVPNKCDADVARRYLGGDEPRR
jgi:hypothetical protein